MVTELERKIIDTPEFQRLRRIKQLGTTYLVYPTALHTRFDHSLGTMQIAQVMMRRIIDNPHNSTEYDENKIEDEQKLLIRLFALLHDIQHIPFGHTLEDEFSVFKRHDEDTERTNYFLGPESTIGSIIKKTIDDNLYNRLMGLFSVKKKELASLGEDRFIYDIVNNTVCADLLDYLKRDSYFCNLDLSMSYRFLNFLYISWDDDKKSRQLVIRLWKKGKNTARKDILSELIRLLDNRYLLAERVYYHHAKINSGAILAAAVSRSKQFGRVGKMDLLEYGDEELLGKLIAEKPNGVSKLASSIRNRVLWKHIYSKNKKELESEQEENMQVNAAEIVDSDWWKQASTRKEKENHISELLRLDPGDVLFSCPGKDMAKKYAQMTVYWNGKLTTLSDRPDKDIIHDKLESINKSHEKLWCISGFLNKKCLDVEKEVISACEYTFALNPIKQQAAYDHYLEGLISREYDKCGVIASKTPKEHEAHKRNILDRLKVDCKVKGNNKLSCQYIKSLIIDEYKTN